MSPGKSSGLAGVWRALSWAVLLGILAGVVAGFVEWSNESWWQSGLVRLAFQVLRERVHAALAIALGLALALLLLARGWRYSPRVTLVAVGGIAGVCAWTFHVVLESELRALLPASWSRATKLALVAGLVLAVGALAAWAAPRLARRAATWSQAPLARRAGRVLGSRGVAFLAGCAALGLVGLELRVQLDRRRLPAGPNLLLITIDTLRADHLGCYGHDRATSPNIDRLAQRGVLFRHALSQAPWTLPSMATVQTSLYPSQHGADSATRRLRPDVDTLAEVLRDAGYHTMAVTSHVFVSPRYGLDQGFAEFETRILDHEGIGSELVTRGALERLATRRREPFFLWVHYFDPHLSYMPHAQYDFADGYRGSLPRRIRYEEVEALEALGASDSTAAEDLRYVKGLYDEEIAYTDAQIGALLDGLEQLGLARNTVVALTADHGDCFGERGRFGHGKDVFPELVRVPLILAGAPQAVAGTVFEAPVETRSIAATLLALAGVRTQTLRGENLLRLADVPAPTRHLFIEGSYAWGGDARKLAVVAGDGWKLVQHLDGGERELYDTTRDPDERTDLCDDPAMQEVLERLQAALDAFRARLPRSSSGLVLDAEERKHLRELGYVE